MKIRRKSRLIKNNFTKNDNNEKVLKNICQKCQVILKHFVIDVKNSFMMKYLTLIKCKKTFKIKKLKKRLF
jgi:hypothetical protein